MNAYQTGYEMGRIGGPVLYLVLFILCARSLGRHGTNRKCVFSLLLLLGFFVLSGIVQLLGYFTQLPGFVTFLLGFSGIILMIASFGFAVAGLIEFKRRHSRYGRKRAVLSIGLVLLLVGLAIPHFLKAQERATADYASPTSGFRVKLSGTPWTKKLGDLATLFPSAEFGRSTVKGENFLVVPLALGDCDPNIDLLAKGIMARWGVVFPGEGISKLRKTVHGPVSGYAFGFQRPATPNLEYRAEILKGNGFAYLLLAFCSKGATANPALEEALVRVEFEIPPQQPANEELAQSLREAHALNFNEIGLTAYRRAAYPVAEACFRRAHQLNPEIAVFVENIGDAMIQQGKNHAALGFFEAAIHGPLNTPSLRAKYAWTQKASGDVRGAVESYSSAFSSGLSDDGALQEFAALLCQQKKADQALAVIGKYIREHDSVAARLTQTFVYRQQRQFDTALKILREQQQKFEGDAQIGLEIARTLFAAERYDEAVKECEKMIADGQTAGNVYFLKARGEYNIKHYREAKASLEAALKEDPANADYKSYLEHLSGMLGQGANTALKSPIEPVAVPAELLNPPAVEESAPYFRGYGGYYVKQARAIAFQKGKEFRTTEYRTVKVLDDSGVNKFSSFEVPFEPLDEEIFVNELTVKDREGKLLSTGKVDDYYVMDDTSSGQAAQHKLLHIPVSDVRLGCEITLTVTRRGLGDAREFRFSEYLFSKGLPVARSLLFVEAEREGFKAGASSGLVEQKSGKGVYWMQDQPPIYRYEPLQLGTELYLPVVWLCGTGTTWKDASKDYLASIEDRLMLDDATRDLAKEKVGNLKKTEEKVVALAGFVQKEITYKAIEFGRRARIPDKPMVVAKNRYGDCKDHAILLRQLLEASGIRAHLVLVNTGSEVRDDMPTIDQFNHMIVFVPSLGKGTFIDCTDKDSAIGLSVPAGLAQKKVLVLDEDNPHLVEIPDYEPDSNHIAITRKIEVVGKTDALVKEDVELKGFPASWHRNFLRRTESANHKKAIQDELAGYVPSLEVLELGLDGLDDARAPLIIHVSYQIKGRFHSAGNQMMGQLPAVWERMFLAMDAVENRRSPFRIFSPMDVESRVEIKLPQGYSEGIAEPVQVDGAFGQCSLKPTSTAGLVRLEGKVHRSTGNYPAAQYSSCKESLGRVVSAFEQNFVFK